MDILIIKLGAMGDVLRTTSILSGLKERYASANISWLVKENSFDLLKNNKLIDNILLIDNQTDIERLSNSEYDLIINLDDDEESCEIATKAKTKKLIGTHIKDRKIAYTEDSAPWFDMGLISKFGKEKADDLKAKNNKTYQNIVCNILGIKNEKPILNLDDENINFARDFAKKNDIKDDNLVIGLNTGAGKRWPLKKWSIEKTAELANRISTELNAKVILFGGPEEEGRNRKILEMSRAPIIDAGCNNSLLDFAALVSLCDIIVCSDSLAMNLAIALKKKVVALFGPTSAAEIELYGRGKKIIAPIDCYCCYKKECDKKPSCMDKISVDEVFNAVKDLK